MSSLWKHALLFAGILALSLLAAATPHASATPGFVTADGQGLVLDGQPYRFVGTNRYNLLTLGGFPYRGCGDWWTESDVSSWLAELKLYTDSNVVRFWAFPLFTADAGVQEVGGSNPLAPTITASWQFL